MYSSENGQTTSTSFLPQLRSWSSVHLHHPLPFRYSGICFLYGARRKCIFEFFHQRAHHHCDHHHQVGLCHLEQAYKSMDITSKKCHHAAGDAPHCCQGLPALEQSHAAVLKWLQPTIRCVSYSQAPCLVAEASPANYSSRGAATHHFLLMGTDPTVEADGCLGVVTPCPTTIRSDKAHLLAPWALAGLELSREPWMITQATSKGFWVVFSQNT